jgi:hypothetical protein
MAGGYLIEVGSAGSVGVENATGLTCWTHKVGSGTVTGEQGEEECLRSSVWMWMPTWAARPKIVCHCAVGVCDDDALALWRSTTPANC